jgi:hypothetical protein
MNRKSILKGKGIDQIVGFIGSPAAHHALRFRVCQWKAHFVTVFDPSGLIVMTQIPAWSTEIGHRMKLEDLNLNLNESRLCQYGPVGTALALSY